MNYLYNTNTLTICQRAVFAHVGFVRESFPQLASTRVVRPIISQPAMPLDGRVARGIGSKSSPAVGGWPCTRPFSSSLCSQRPSQECRRVSLSSLAIRGCKLSQNAVSCADEARIMHLGGRPMRPVIVVPRTPAPPLPSLVPYACDVGNYPEALGQRHGGRSRSHGSSAYRSGNGHGR